MTLDNKLFVLSLIAFLPLVGAMITGLFKQYISRAAAHWLTTSSVGLSFVFAALLMVKLLMGKMAPFEQTLYIWASAGGLNLQVGFLFDQLTAIMMTVVTFVSFMVHIYTIGYMQDDPGYQRFFSYIALFTFAMLMLVMSNNFMQLFFGWEAVGVVSYLLIGFWFKKETAIFANLKAFLVNRVGDFGFVLGIAGVLAYFGTLDYLPVFAKAKTLVPGTALLASMPALHVMPITLICILLFVGAMGKSAQVPLHVWLPDSMEGPTPISALIHAATMVTAGVFMVARMSPLFELSDTARSVVLVIGAITCLLMGLLGVVQRDIKRVIAYSTLSQLGYMVTALGASAYSFAIFHLVTHAFFKALLFLGAGSCIMCMHHKQDIFEMGNLRKYMPITYLTMLMGSLAIIGFPGFAGFYSKDLIIEAVHHLNLPGAGFAYFAVTASVFVTALYSFRLFFLVFHTKERMDDKTKSHLQESPAVVWVPLVLLAIPSVISGAVMLNPVMKHLFTDSIFVLASHQSVAKVAEDVLPMGWWHFALHGFLTLPFMLALAGVLVAFVFYVQLPLLPDLCKRMLKPIYLCMLEKYGFDAFNQHVIAKGTRGLSNLFGKVGDKTIIDGYLVNGSASLVAIMAKWFRRIQTGYLYHYAFMMIIGLLGLLVWLMKL